MSSITSVSPIASGALGARAAMAIALTAGALSAAVLLAPLLTVLALGAIVLAGLGLARPAWGFGLLVFSIPMLSSVARGRVVPVLAPNEILLLTLAGLLLLRAMLRPQSVPAHDRVLGGFIVFSVLGAVVPLVAFAVRSGGLSSADVRESLIYVQYYVLFLLTIGSVRTREDVVLVIRAVLVSSMVVSLLGILQVLEVPFAIALVREVFMTPEHLERFGYLLTQRATSTLGAWNGLGVYLTAVAYLALALFYVRPRRGPAHDQGPHFFGRPFLLTVLAVDVCGVVASGSYTGLVTLSIGFAVILAATGRGRHLLAWMLLALGGAVLLREVVWERFTIQFAGGESALPLHLLSRFVFWQMIADELARGTNVLFGIRPSIPPGAPWITEDNYYVHLLARGGVAFLAGFAALMWALVTLARRAWRDGSVLTRALGIAFATTLLQLTMISVTGTFFRFSGYAETIWILAALSTVCLARTAGGVAERNDPAQPSRDSGAPPPGEGSS